MGGGEGGARPPGEGDDDGEGQCDRSEGNLEAHRHPRTMRDDAPFLPSPAVPTRRDDDRWSYAPPRRARSARPARNVPQAKTSSASLESTTNPSKYHIQKASLQKAHRPNHTAAASSLPRCFSAVRPTTAARSFSRINTLGSHVLPDPNSCLIENGST